MPNTKNTFDDTLEAIMQMDDDSREMLMEIVRHRQAESRRKKIAKNAVTARKDFQSGKLQPIDASELIANLRKK